EPLSIEREIPNGISRKTRTEMAALALIQSEEQRDRFQAKLKRELGALVLSHLADPRTEDIVLNPDSVLWVKRFGEGFYPIGEMPPTQAASALHTIAAWRGTTLHHDRPILETELPLDGSRFEGLVAPVVREPVFAIRTRARRIFTLEDYDRAGILTEKHDPRHEIRRRTTFRDSIQGLSHRKLIRTALRKKRNILVVGATGSGKTTFLNACLAGIAELRPSDRVISIEDTM